MIHKEIVNYVRNGLKKGVNLNELKRNLFAKGWTKQDIEESVKSVKPKATKTVFDFMDPRLALGIFAGILIILAVLFYISFQNNSPNANYVDPQNSLSCYEEWDCSSWTSCDDGTKTRTCSDSNECGTYEIRPSVERNCVSLFSNVFNSTDDEEDDVDENPQISIKSPSSSETTYSILINATVSDDNNEVSTCYYGLSLGGSTLVSEIYLNISDLNSVSDSIQLTTDGDYTLNFVCKDSEDNIGSASLDFNVDTTIPIGPIDPINESESAGSICVEGVCTDPTGKINSVCGNGVKEGVEECDDGNLVSEDGCSSDCLNEVFSCTGLFEENKQCQTYLSGGYTSQSSSSDCSNWCESYVGSENLDCCYYNSDSNICDRGNTLVSSSVSADSAVSCGFSLETITCDFSLESWIPNKECTDLTYAFSEITTASTCRSLCESYSGSQDYNCCQHNVKLCKLGLGVSDSLNSSSEVLSCLS